MSLKRQKQQAETVKPQSEEAIQPQAEKEQEEEELIHIIFQCIMSTLFIIFRKKMKGVGGIRITLGL